jgi:hypothetical protein
MANGSVRNGGPRRSEEPRAPWITDWVRPRRSGPTEPEPRREGGKTPAVKRGSVSYTGIDRVVRPPRGRGG